MLKRIIKAGVLTAVFVVTLIVSSMVVNRGTDDEIVDMGAPTLPRISFMLEGSEINALAGYVDEMEITAMRDTITPIGTNGTLQMMIDPEGNKISRIVYQVYSLNGSEVYKEGKVEVPQEGEGVTLTLNDAFSASAREAVLKVTLTADRRPVSFYTRIERPDQVTSASCLAFAQDFHRKALDKSASEELEAYLEPGMDSDNTTYQTVNIHSDIDHIQWGELAPQVSGDVEWSIMESNSVYTSILAKYQVVCQNDLEENAAFNVREFFRVRIIGETVFLLNYNRDMQEIFSGSRQVVDEDGILIGIANPDVRYETNEDETIVAFVQERDLWLYKRESGEFYQVFSFADREGNDVRSRYDQHAVRLISMDNGGNLAFAVYGYMNRGTHEGEVGVGIYYFDIGCNSIEEKAFIPSTKSFAIAEEELGKMVYYNHGKSMLHVLAEGTLYQVDLAEDVQSTLAEGLAENEYTVSDDGHLLAYCSGTSELQVMDLKAGKTFKIAGAGESVKPLGFIHGDFIYGKQRAEDAGKTASGEEIMPMYAVEIRNEKNEVEANYSFESSGIYVTDVLIDGNLVTLNRVAKEGNVYNGTSQEYITNNEERESRDVNAEAYTTKRLEKQMRLTFSKGTKKTEFKVFRPNQLISREPLTITLSGTETGEKYYVYGMGELVAVYDKAGYAIQKAEQVSGVVISSSQAYVWEKGNRDLAYSTDAESFGRRGEETSLEACERYMEKYNARRVDLTGCSLDQVLYVINKGCPVIGLTDVSHAVLLTGYSLEYITYIDPYAGAEYTVTYDEMEEMLEGSGNTFVGYIR